MNSKHLKLSAIAAAVFAAYAGDASAAAISGTFYGAGASAAFSSMKAVILAGPNYCAGTPTSTTIDLYEGVSAGLIGGGSVVEIVCTNTAGTLDVGYDSSGGSWKAFTAVSSNLFNLAKADGVPNAAQIIDPAQRTTSTACAASVLTVDSYSGIQVNDHKNCPIISATTQPTFGLTDVALKSFLSGTVNQPVKAAQQLTYTYISSGYLLDPNWNADIQTAQLSTFPQPAFGVVFGVAASRQLYTALQADQLASTNVPASLPSTCSVGTISQACAPNISRAQYRSLFMSAGSNLNLGSIKQLFPNTTPSDLTIVVARRDQGSGTQASSNDFNFNLGFGNGSVENTNQLPALPTDSGSPAYNVQYNNSTTNEIDALNNCSNCASGASSQNIIAWISAEKDGSLAGGAGFLKLDGVYPSNTNAALGLYPSMSEENIHANTSANPTFMADLVSISKTYHATGIVPVFVKAPAASFPALAPDSKGNPTQSYYQTGNDNITGLVSY